MTFARLSGIMLFAPLFAQIACASRPERPSAIARDAGSVVLEAAGKPPAKPALEAPRREALPTPPPPAPPKPAAPSPSPLVDLAVPGHPAAVIALPREGKRPLLVATHGAGGTPEAHCAYWQALLGDTAFVLCPRGVTMDVYAPPDERGYFYSNHPALEREVRDAIAALAARFPDQVDLDRAAYAGYSQGATMGALAFGLAPAPFAALVLVEGGSDDWSGHSAKAFKAGGGKRVIFACGRQTCTDGAKRSSSLLRKAGVETRIVDATGAGHTHDGSVKDGIAAALPWLFQGDDRFDLPK